MRSFVLALLLCWSAVGSAAPAKLRFSAVDSWAMPLAEFRENRLVGGILHDLILRLAEHLDMPAQIQVLPRNRVELALIQGEIDVRCYISPKWVANSNEYLWSLPFIYQRDLIVARQGSQPLASPDVLAGESIGTVLGYTYPRLQRLFDRGALQRDEARTQELVLQKLLAGRYRYALSNELALGWFNRDLPDADHLVDVGTLEEEPIGCLVRNDPAVPAQRILRTLVQMKESGEIEEILARYR
ncbi:ABC transporter substrate-binding protein [Metapseudomonas resinovorans]|uniref:Putative ABC transporter substrate-binding protein n=1 Tax=Metapseudomonas resinovorans NBRC 106553 TaxID=1245471 RepID=S6APQ9_METRE|nr:transporter substrate-binding domain-containing protein [Pseudomonas resinovorans]BAN47683.1 putative ABC transporter substrate-binding protein [Pseudomonas resinovorans NBRC 106553]